MSQHLMMQLQLGLGTLPAHQVLQQGRPMAAGSQERGTVEGWSSEGLEATRVQTALDQGRRPLLRSRLVLNPLPRDLEQLASGGQRALSQTRL